MLALTLCRSGADSGGYPSRKTDTPLTVGSLASLSSCALSVTSLTGLPCDDGTKTCRRSPYGDQAPVTPGPQCLQNKKTPCVEAHATAADALHVLPDEVGERG